MSLRRWQNGSLKRKPYKNGKLRWRFQWRAPGEKNPTTAWLGFCSEMSKAEARAEADQILAPIHAGRMRQVQASKWTLSDYIDLEFVETKKGSRWRVDSSLGTNQGLLEHLKTALGTKHLQKITRSDLQRFLNGLADDNYSYSVVQHLHSFIKQIFDNAVGDLLIPVNPASSVEIPKCKPAKAKPMLPPDRILKFLMYLSIRDQVWVLFEIVMGLRPSETEGLQLKDVGDDRIWIRRRVYRGRTGEVKTGRSDRELPIPPEFAPFLREYRKLLLRDGPDDWFFPSENPEKPLDYRNVFRRRIKPALMKAGLSDINYQAMRRTFSTEAKVAGVDTKTRSDMMGHGKVVNEETYTITPFDVKQEAMAKIAKRLLHRQ